MSRILRAYTGGAMLLLPSNQRLPNLALFPYKGFSNISTYMSDSTSNYHALQAQLSKRTGRFFFTLGYTFSKALGDASGQGDNSENYTDRHYNYGPLSFDRRHAVVATYVWSLPQLRNWSLMARTAFGAWQLSGILRLQSGQYYTVTGNTSIGGRRADYVGGMYLRQAANEQLITGSTGPPSPRRQTTGSVTPDPATLKGRGCSPTICRSPRTSASGRVTTCDFRPTSSTPSISRAITTRMQQRAFKAFAVLSTTPGNCN